MYIGSYEISKEEKDIKGYTKVSFKAVKDGEKIEDKIFADCIIDKLRTKEPMDETFVREQVCVAASEEVNLVLLKYNLKVIDFQHLITTVQQSLQHNAEKADEAKWGMLNSERTVLDVHKALTK